MSADPTRFTWCVSVACKSCQTDAQTGWMIQQYPHSSVSEGVFAAPVTVAELLKSQRGFCFVDFTESTGTLFCIPEIANHPNYYVVHVFHCCRQRVLPHVLSHILGLSQGRLQRLSRKAEWSVAVHVNSGIFLMLRKFTLKIILYERNLMANLQPGYHGQVCLASYCL